MFVYGAFISLCVHTAIIFVIVTCKQLINNYFIDKTVISQIEKEGDWKLKRKCLRETLRVIYRVWLKLQRIIFIVSMLITCLDCSTMCCTQIEAVKLIIFNVLKSKENLALKSRLSHAATITKQINAIQEGIALTMKS